MYLDQAEFHGNESAAEIHVDLMSSFYSCLIKYAWIDPLNKLKWDFMVMSLLFQFY